MKIKIVLFFVLSFGILSLNAQNKFSLSGYVKDAETGEELIGATVFVKELTTGTVTNVYGFYSLSLPEGNYTISYSYVGFDETLKEINLTSDQKFDIELTSGGTNLSEIVVTTVAPDENVTSNEMSIVKINTRDIAKIPVLFGEKDILKTIQLMPGVSSVGEGNSGFYVRGGSADQNLILIDEAPVYNASHLLGFFSVFNSDAIKDIKLYKAGIPAEYGGRLSSVLDVKMNNGNDKKISATGGIGLIASRLTIEGPIVKNKGSFIVSGRRTYADLFLKLSNNETINKSKLYFYDLNLKANYRLNENNRIFLSGYFGRDVLGFSDRFGLDWGNFTSTLRWNHTFNDRWFLNTSVIYSKYSYDIDIRTAGFKILSFIEDINLKEDFEFFPNTKNKIKFGVNTIFHTFSPGKFVTSSSDRGLNDFYLDNQYAFENAAYVSNEQELTKRLKLTYGLRYSAWSNFGYAKVYEFDEDGDVSNETEYDNREHINTFQNLEPRISANYSINEFSSFKASYNRTTQYIHLLSNSGAGSPLDLWKPSSFIIKPELADQIALGYFRNFEENKYETSVEIYYKSLKNQIDYKTNPEIFFNPYVENELLFGDGFAYGVELFAKKRFGKLNGWIGYTLATSQRKFVGINNGETYPAKQDRRHDISIVAMYDLNEKWNFSATWVYNTGNAVTFPSGKYTYEGDVIALYTDRNASRMPDYHRLDLGATWQRKKSEKFESSWNFSVYNAYARKNAYFIDFRDSETNPGTTEAVKVSLFSIVPAITWNFKF